MQVLSCCSSNLPLYGAWLVIICQPINSELHKPRNRTTTPAINTERIRLTPSIAPTFPFPYMQPVMMPGQPPTGHASRHRDYRRTYKACNACRQKKVRCIPDPSGFLSGPCARCRRESRQCLFGADHSARAKKLTDIIQSINLSSWHWLTHG